MLLRLGLSPEGMLRLTSVNGRSHSFYVKSLKASGVNQAFLHTNEALVPSPKRLANNVLFANFDSWTRAVHIEVLLR